MEGTLAAAAVAMSTSLSPTITARSRAAARHLDGAGQMAGRGLEHIEGVAAGDDGEAMVEPELPQQRFDSSSNLLVQTASRAPPACRAFEHFGDAFVRPAEHGHVVRIVGEEQLVQPVICVLGLGLAVQAQTRPRSWRASRGR